MEHAVADPQAARLLWLIPALPLAGFVVNALLGAKLQRAFGKRAVHAVAIAAVAAAFLVALACFVELLGLPAEDRLLHQRLWNVFTIGRLSVDFAFALDPLSMTLVLVITGIGSLIHLFSVGYMADEPSYWRFFCYLNLFVFAMLLLVMGDNLAVMFFGWEGVGLASYLLISFWYSDPEKAKAGMKAFVVNRIGDFGFLLGILVLFWALGGAWMPRQGGGLRATDYQPVAELRALDGDAAAAPAVAGVKVGPTLAFRELRDQLTIEETGVRKRLDGMTLWGVPVLALVAFLLFIGAMGKSAQLPLYVWLPDAMAGPTPVSALIHAATMVTAGVYMVARLSFLFALSASAMGWVALVGALTAAFAATIGFFQYDIKKVLAYSTVSQLGFMFIGVGVGAYWAGTYHLLTHAFFKATLFLAAGSVILGCHHEQDMRKMGGLAKHMPWTRWAYLVACIAIAGFPIANGFYSKDEILWKAFTSNHLALFGVKVPWLGPAIWALGLLTATGTAFYMYRSYYMTFSGTYRGGPEADAGHGHGHEGHGHTPHESPWTVTSVLVILAAGSVLTLFLGLPALWTHAPPLFEHWLEPVLAPATKLFEFRETDHSLEWLFQGLGVAAAFAGWLAARALYKDGRSEVPARLKARFTRAWTVVYEKYYVDELYAFAVVRPLARLAALLAWFDTHLVDGIVNLVGALARFASAISDVIDRYGVDWAVNGVANLTRGAGGALRRLQTGRVQTYLYGALGGALVVVLLNFLLQ
ncbi:MAG TPA: NADH-quinone oxidoreductase subunit L [Anaeromyxobacter sp.]|nr:NADH-quinone oxidoreductase subunit L [Anaeromyxobacter sp.]